MTKYTTSHLLESIARLTSLRDQRSLEVCLVKSLHTLIPETRIMLFGILPGESAKPSLKLLAKAWSAPANLIAEPEKYSVPHRMEDDPGLLQCFTTGKQLVTGDGGAVRGIHPVSGMDGMAGFLTVQSKTFEEQDQEMVAGFLRVYQNYLQLINDNEHDTLTGLLNRKAFDERIQTIMSAQRAGQRRISDTKALQYCLAILDIDHFKKVNDQFGHLYGDEVLLLFAQIMRRAFRDEDQLFRYGGEEFVVVLKNVDLNQGLAVLERFLKAVEVHPFPQVGNITASAGVVEINGQDLPTTVIGQADQALYHAKENGRNQVCAYEKLLRQGKLPSKVPTAGDVELF